MASRNLKLALAAAFLAAACSPTSRSVPGYNDGPGIDRAAASLSPWDDDKAAHPTPPPENGEPNSDRQVFVRWMMRYRYSEDIAKGRTDYTPFTVPASIGEAIALERAFERAQQAKTKPQPTQQPLEQLNGVDDQREVDDDAAFYARQAEQGVTDNQTAVPSAANQQAAADKAEQDRRDAEFNAAETAKKDAAYRAQLAETKQEQLDYECRRKRQEAASASIANGTNADAGNYQRVWDSYHCRAN